MIPVVSDIGQAIEDALAQGDIPEAARLAEAALDAGLDDPLFCNLAAWKREVGGDYAGAEKLLRRALKRAPDDPYTRIGLASLRRRQGRVDEAIALLDAVVAALPENAGAKLERAYAFEDVGLLERAVEDYREAARLDPEAASAHAGLASVYSRLGKVGQARDVAEVALRLDPANLAAICALARCDLEDGEPRDTIARLSPLEGREGISGGDKIIVLGVLGDAHDRLGQAEAAFTCYKEAKALFASSDRREKDSVPQRAFIEEIAREVEASRVDDWLPSIPASGASDHAFLLGYPRSGTTLIESVLAAVPGVETAEERPTLREADMAFLAPTLKLDELRQLSQEAAEELRTAYWGQVGRLGVERGCKLFVDMDPLKGIKLPIISKLFPDARIIVMRRDPRDVVWSCFHTNFAPSAAAYEFTSLEKAARHYDALMTLMDRCFEKMPLRWMEVRYEDLVGDFDEATGRLCSFLGLQWTEELRKFDQVAARRNITTASAPQVRKGLYDGGGQWKRYEAQLASILPILEPWVRKFGYAV